MPDMGASQSIGSADTARAANLSIRPTMTELRNANNGVMNLLGEADVVLCNDKHSAQTVVLVASDLNHSALISWQDLQKLRVIPASFPAMEAVAQCFKDLKTQTLSAFPSVFSNTLDNKPMCAQRMRIYLKDKSVPYRVSAHGQYLSVSRSPQTRIFLSTLLRVCLVTDYTKLNQYVIRPVHPFPSVSNIIQSIPASAICFAKLDA